MHSLISTGQEPKRGWDISKPVTETFGAHACIGIRCYEGEKKAIALYMILSYKDPHGTDGRTE